MGFLNRKLIDFILDIDILRGVDRLSKRDISNIVNSIKNFKFKVNGSRGFESAEVVKGGVDTKYVYPNSMESKIIKGLYFTGEVVDVDGRGGDITSISLE